MKQTQKQQLKEAGSFFNYLMANNSSVPVVNKGATILLYTDRQVVEVIEVSKDGKKVIIEHLDATNTGKQFGEQEWEFSPTGRTQTIVWRNNAWRVEAMRIDFTEDIVKEAIDNGTEYVGLYVNKKYPDVVKEIYGNNMFPVNVVEGFTKAKKVYSKINIVFGVKNYYYDYSF